MSPTPFLPQSHPAQLHGEAWWLQTVTQIQVSPRCPPCVGSRTASPHWSYTRVVCVGGDSAAAPPLPDATAAVTSSSACPPAKGCEQLPILCSSDPSMSTRGPLMTQAALLTCGLCFWANPRHPVPWPPEHWASSLWVPPPEKRKRRQQRDGRSTSGAAKCQPATQLPGQEGGGSWHPPSSLHWLSCRLLPRPR